MVLGFAVSRFVVSGFMVLGCFRVYGLTVDVFMVVTCIVYACDFMFWGVWF